MLNGDQVQRLGTHIAAIRPELAQITDEVIERLAAAFPQARAAITPQSRAERYVLNAQFGFLAKNLGELDDLAGHFRALGRQLSERGFDCAAGAPIASRALLDALRDASELRWNKTLEADWRDLIAQVFGLLAQGSARQLGAVRLAA